MNLAKKYKKLFEGKTRSNDAVLLTERLSVVGQSYGPAEDIVDELKRNSVLKRLGLDRNSLKVTNKDRGTLRDNPFIIMNFTVPDRPEDLAGLVDIIEVGNSLVKWLSAYKELIWKELEKILGKMDQHDVFLWDNIEDYEVVSKKTKNAKYQLEFQIHSEWFGDSPIEKMAKEGDGVIETLANLSTAEIRKIEKSIYIEDGSVEGRDRQVNGTIEIAGKEYTWRMETGDGQSSSYLGDELDEDGVLHDILIDAVEKAGYGLDDEWEDDGSDLYTP